MAKSVNCVNNKYSEYSDGVPSWNGSLRKYYRDFQAGKVGQEVKVYVRVGETEYTRPLSTQETKEAKRKVKQWLKSPEGEDWVEARLQAASRSRRTRRRKRR